MEQTTQDEQVAATVQAMVAGFGDDWPRLRPVAARVVWAVDPAAGAFVVPTLDIHTAFKDPDERRVREALYVLSRACGVEEGGEIGRPLRAAILAGLGLKEPELPPWVRPGAYAFSPWHGARGLNLRIVRVSPDGVLLAGRRAHLEAGLFLAGWRETSEAFPKGLPCAACGLERDYSGFCNGCPEPLRLRCLEDLRRGCGHSRFVDLAGGSDPHTQPNVYVERATMAAQPDLELGRRP